MATRHHPVVVSKQQRGEAVHAGKKKVVAGADGRNRQALGNIGNLVNLRGPDGKPVYQINRPVTRSFGAQLLANAAAAAAAAANKKPVAVDVAVAKVVKQKQIVNTEEETKHAAPKNSHSNSSMKKVQTLTSVLTARSKVACGVVDKPKDQKVHDIDALDADDQLAVVDYVEDIYKFYKHSERSYRPDNYMESQIEINAKMRAILADWLIEVHQKFELMPETLYLTFYVIDRYLSMAGVLRRELQLVGVSSMLIACKYEEIWAPEVSDFICISDMAYTREEILAMEKEILNKLEWNLTVPTPYVFLVRFLKASQCDEEMENMVFFLAELALLHYSMIKYCPSMLAASAVYAARCTLKKSPLWSETLKCHTGFSEPELLECSKMLVNFHSLSAESRLKVVQNKYSSSQRCAVALQLPVIKMFEGLKLSD